jgi:biotin-dependent carboxylase-like uncharacterized protein
MTIAIKLKRDLLSPENMKTCKVIRSGILSLVQDRGRPHHYSEGIPVGGAFDSVAFKLGNLALGNDLNAAGIEVLLGGLCLEFLEKTWIVITGADLGARIDDRPAPMWTTFPLASGQRLTFTDRRNGLRAYILFAGGIDVPYFMGSRSTHLALGKGGFKGRKLEKGDILETFFSSEAVVPRRLPSPLPPHYGPPWNLRMIYGQQDAYFTDSSLKLFELESWTATSAVDRRGLRLHGPPLEFKKTFGSGSVGGSDPSNIPAEGHPLGSIQYPGKSLLIISGPDGPCCGGYAKIGTIITADYFFVGQIMPGDSIKFKPVSLEEAYEVLYQQKAMFEDAKTLESFP